MEDGIQHCEEQFLSVAISHGLCRGQEPVMSLEDTLHSHTDIPSMMLGKAVDYKQIADSLKMFMQARPSALLANASVHSISKFMPVNC